MQYLTLLTQSDVVRFAGLGASFPTCDIKDILHVEMLVFRECFTPEFYEQLRGMVADYSTTQAWASGLTLADTVVRHKGVYWIANEDTNSEPIVENQYWSLAPKFDNSTVCGKVFNEFYCMFLAPFIAYRVALHIAGRHAVTMTGSGITVKTGDGFAPASTGERAIWFQSMTNAANVIKANMEFYMSKNAQCFPAADTCGCDNGICSNKQGYSIT